MISTHNNKFLTFLLDGENYGIPILEVKEIIGVMEITHIPKMPNFVKGVVNLRGKIIPVIDLRLKFGISEKEYDERTCIIVVEIATLKGNALSGFIVDMVSEVLDILPESIESVLTYSSESKQAFFKGLGKVKEKVVMILDSNSMFTDEEKDHIDVSSSIEQKELEIL